MQLDVGKQPHPAERQGSESTRALRGFKRGSIRALSPFFFLLLLSSQPPQQGREELLFPLYVLGAEAH